MRICLYYSYGIYHAHAVTRLRSKYRQPYLESGLESDAESDVESGLESDVESDVESGLESDAESDAESDVENDVEVSRVRWLISTVADSGHPLRTSTLDFHSRSFRDKAF